jgi:hypothetical protein
LQHYLLLQRHRQNSNMKRWSFITVLSLLIVLSCKKEDGLPKDIPDCLRQTIETAKQNEYGIEEVVEYEYQGQIVYAHTPSSKIADTATPIYDVTCNYVCSVGGFGGPMISQCNGEKFFDKAIKKRVIWTR